MLGTRKEKRSEQASKHDLLFFIEATGSQVCQQNLFLDFQRDPCYSLEVLVGQEEVAHLYRTCHECFPRTMEKDVSGARRQYHVWRRQEQLKWTSGRLFSLSLAARLLQWLDMSLVPSAEPSLQRALRPSICALRPARSFHLWTRCHDSYAKVPGCCPPACLACDGFVRYLLTLPTSRNPSLMCRSHLPT